MKVKPLPIPDHYQAEQVGQCWKVAYEQRAQEARAWAARHGIQPAAGDQRRIGLLLIDVQNTFCLPDFELFVRGRSGTGAIDDNRRLCEFIYRNLGSLTEVYITLDTHQAQQIFHAVFLVDEYGGHPGPYTLVTAADIEQRRWRFNPALAGGLGLSQKQAAEHLAYYTAQLSATGKYDLTIWPYHAMLGGIGHALAPAVEEALFFHNIARYSQTEFIIKGQHPLTESYSAIGPEVLTTPDGSQIADKSERIFNRLQKLDALYVAGQAKSHCVAWTIADLLRQIEERQPALAERVYLLEDCASPVVVPGTVDFTEQADEAYQRFAAAGMQIVRSTDALKDW
jgi:nicotinamidase-related amidase